MLRSTLLNLFYKTLDGRDLAKGLVRSRSKRDVNHHLCRFFNGEPRDWVAGRIARRLPNAERVAAADDPRVLALDDKGYAMLPGLITTSEVDALRSVLETIPCHDPYRPELGTFSKDAIPAQSHVAHLDTAALLRVPALLRLANDPDVLAIVGRQLGAKPTALLTAWWSSPTGAAPQQAELFHRDKDDWRFLKLFLYLTDVTEDSGPHIYVPSSHRYGGPEFRRQRRYDDTEVSRVFGEAGIHQFIGPRGTAFLENTYGLHRGLPPRSGLRLCFQVNYSLLPLLGSPEEPQVRASEIGLDLDPWINRLHVAN